MKKILKIAGIISLIASIYYIVEVFLDIFVYQFSVMYLVLDSMSTVISIGTGITYLILMNKDKNYLTKHGNIFFVLTIINIFNSLIVWAVAFWVQIMASRENISKRSVFVDMGSYKQNDEPEGDSSNTIELDEDSYTVNKTAKNIAEKLEELKILKDKKLIDEQEYEKMRQEILKNMF